MGIIIRKIDDEYWLEHVSHTPINFTPFTNPTAINDFIACLRVGKIIPYDLKIDEEIELNWYTDFVVVDRIPMYGKGDIVTYVYNPHLVFHLRRKKLERILCVK